MKPCIRRAATLTVALVIAAITGAADAQDSAPPGDPGSLPERPPAASRGDDQAAECARRRAAAATAAGPDAALLVLLADVSDGPAGANRNTDFEYLCPLRPRTAAILVMAPRPAPAAASAAPSAPSGRSGQPSPPTPAPPRPAAPVPEPSAGPAPPEAPRAGGPNAVATTAASDRAEPGADRIYLNPRNPAVERWTGPEPAPDPVTAAAAAFGEARTLDRLVDDLAGIAATRRTILVSAGPAAYSDPWMRRIVAALRAKLPGRLVRFADGPLATRDDLADALRAALPANLPADAAAADVVASLPATEIRAARRLMTDLRRTKSPAEIAQIRAACAATVTGIRDALRAARPGLVERDLAAIVELRCRQLGCARQAFPSIAAAGPNSCILHYDRNAQTLADGDIVVLDVGGEHGGYAADVTRSFPVSGRFTDDQARIYDAVLAAQEAALAEVRPGATIVRVHDAAVRSLEGSRMRRFFTHQTCHSVGLDVHDPWRREIALAPGMVITVEPGVYDAANATGVRIEDTVLVTETGYELLSTGLPRTRAEIEALMREDPPVGLLAPR